MLKALGKLLFALLFDEKRGRRWLRGIAAILAVQGARYSHDLAALHVPDWALTALNSLCLFCAFAVAVHGEQLRPRSKLKPLEPPRP